MRDKGFLVIVFIKPKKIHSIMHERIDNIFTKGEIFVLITNQRSDMQRPKLG